MRHDRDAFCQLGVFLFSSAAVWRTEAAGKRQGEGSLLALPGYRHSGQGTENKEDGGDFLAKVNCMTGVSTERKSGICQMLNKSNSNKPFCGCLSPQ